MAGIRWPCMAALSLCLFDIWPERTAGMKRTCARKDGVESGWMGLFISCLAEYTTCVKKKKKRKKKREMKGRHAETPLMMSKQRCLNDLPGERESRISFSPSL